MTTRRDFLRKGSMALAAATLVPAVGNAARATGQTSAFAVANDYKSMRPALEKRNFTSQAVEATIQRIKAKIKDPKLAWMFENCFPNTIDTTVDFRIRNGKPDTFVLTGDIHAMWLRDSSAQVFPYLPLAKEDDHLRQMIEGVIRQQTKCILIDPYANAFNDGPIAGGGHWATDMTDMKDELHERKWEIDSLCYPIRLAYHYWKTTGDDKVFDTDWAVAMDKVVQTFIEQQRKHNLGPYRFQRKTEKASDTLLNNGYGWPVKPVGLIVSSFRPSDDASQYNFLVPSNIFAVTSLRQVAEICNKVTHNAALETACNKLANEVDAAIRKYAIVNHPTHGKVYAFEVDGFGNALFMDDANVPSLLAIPYLGGCSKTDPVYLATRRMIWSESNPYFFKGKAAEGIGGPHIGIDYIWPMSLIMKALTSTSADEQRACLKKLVETDGDTGFMHESFHKDDPKDFTRSWFAWANTLFGELVIKLVDEKVI